MEFYMANLWLRQNQEPGLPSPGTGLVIVPLTFLLLNYTLYHEISFLPTPGRLSDLVIIWNTEITNHRAGLANMPQLKLN